MFALLAENEFGFSLFHAEELIDLGVHFVADRFARLQVHQDKLGVSGGENRRQGLSEFPPEMEQEISLIRIPARSSLPKNSSGDQF